MANQIVYDYLKEYKDKYNLDELKKEILSKGYSEFEFSEALSAVRANEPKKFQVGELNRLPSNHYVEENKGRGRGFFWYFFIFLLILIFGFVIVIAVNFYGIDIFGFNVFKYIAKMRGL
jgi:hypothetical protein